MGTKLVSYHMIYNKHLTISICVLAIACQGLLESESDDRQSGTAEWRLAREPDPLTEVHEDNIFYSAIHFADSKHGWVVGDSGTVLYTKDGGESWENQDSGTSSELRSVYFVNHQKGWAAGYTALLTTNDGGESWQPLPLPIDTTHGITSIHFADDQLGWLTHNGGEVLCTQDGGDTWETQLNWGSGAGKLSFVDRNLGYVFGFILRDKLLWTTQDGGNNWSSFPFLLARWPTDIFFINQHKGWICESVLASSLGGEMASVFHTNDGGASWDTLATLDEQHFTAIQFVDENVGWLAASNRIYQTTDGGKTWDREYNPEEEDAYLGFRDFFFLDATHGWALGFKGGICIYSEI